MNNYLESERIILRILTSEDFTPLFNILSDEETVKYFVDRPFTEEKIKTMVNKVPQEHYAIVLKKEKLMVGYLDFYPWFMRDTYDIGWTIDKSYRNLGIVTEAATLLMIYAFEVLGTHRLVATCQPENIPSNRICKKLNMRLEGTFKKCIYDPNEDNWLDENLYAILKEEYENEN
ncbi:MAG: GNAT family protein [Candidatus Izemoplasmatales bacterium]|nr:GNAT family protein [Candidatus Izemoplasmatales bacterium]